ncbi:MAG: polysaccharide deacetylase family protein [Patiriisocius sp.]|uniref:polysaccharide deacetylase family protein n=1 Tax=Patiriisocius sp. TaxID=2822396 RepID=UPI003EF69FE7
MLLIFTQKVTPRVTYAFKHICTRILGIEVKFTTEIETFISHTGAKISYGKQALGNELFFQSHGLLTQMGIESVDVSVKKWEGISGFFFTNDKSAMPFDLFAASFYLLSRYEEYQPHVKDALGRYPASESLAFKNGFLKTPVIDVWAHKFKMILNETFNDLKFPKKKLKTSVIVNAQAPYAYVQKGAYRSLIAYFKDLVGLRFNAILNRTRVIFGFRRDPYDTFKWLVNVTKNNRLKLCIFFLLGEASSFEESINTHRNRFKTLIKLVADYHQVGLLISEKALRNPEILKTEKNKLEHITNRNLLGSLNLHFVVNLPDIYRNLVELEIEKDYTMVYENVVGFRAGTCTPFLFYDLDYEIRTPLIIYPVSCTSRGFSRMSPNDISDTVKSLLETVRSVDGTFSMIFSNHDFSIDPNNKVWRTLLSETIPSYEK